MSKDDSMKAPNRRQVLGTMGLVGAGLVLGTGTTALGQDAGAATDAAVLNFALNLEYLEAAFYSAVAGKLDAFKALGGGDAAIILPEGVSGNTPSTFANPDFTKVAAEIAMDEMAHVKFLRAALGSAAVDRPTLDIGPAFAAAATATARNAGLIKGDADLTPAFNPYANDLFFLHGAFIFEDVGVTAYKGAARLISNKDYLEAAAGILSVEAYHAGEIRKALYRLRGEDTPYGVKVGPLVNAISALRAAVGGGKDQGIVNSDDSANIVPADENGIAFSRSTSEVLAIVYLGGSGKGGFFPDGLNGAIK